MIPSRLIPQLGAAADQAINQVLKSGATRAGQKKPTGEVGFVAAVVLGGVPAIAKAWTPILNPAGYSVAITGVFCHITPQVTFQDSSGAQRQCELADLLVIAEDQTGTTPARRWAALIQAKMAKPAGGQTLSVHGDLVQLELMSRWPKFSMPGGYASHARDLSTCTHPGATLDCGSYGLIAPQPNPSWHQQPPAKKMPSGGNELGTFLAHMVERGQRGFGREATGTADDWSFTVEELLKVAAQNTFAHSPSLQSRKPRVNTAVAFAYDDREMHTVFGAAPPSGGKNSNADSDQPPDESQGVSAVVIQVIKKRE